ncbi:AB hydrolase-1 domain-containing protein [Candidatus Hydrogenisulfobacillus filiaventi]|uniref:AB hydrolase-1 domain-containing protein n=1 Tax=Candidatus Hydrogenisulfobacillus filiaventi TaxID=2707344 RepID=A0A6F8ZDU3_9FIRM|nr:alpha/beta fold hydrolase [Bacillota bacterium]CAB1127622.1 AB hydrolase-1 domain-containing protein [Candidatus Hydrogenisulfobacillus filiaventi]
MPAQAATGPGLIRVYTARIPGPPPLAAVGYGPGNGVPRKVRVVALHGYSSSKHSLDPLSAELARAGFAVLAPDLPGHKLGASGGVLFQFETAVEAALAAAHAFAGDGPVVFVGHSMGAAAAVVAAAALPAAGAVSLGLGYPVTRERDNPAVYAHYLERWAWVDGASPLEAGLAMDAALPGALQALAGRPWLLVHGSRDLELPPASADALFALAGEPKTRVMVDADHAGVATAARTAVRDWLLDRFA